MADINLTAADQATTSVELQAEDATWLADELGRFDAVDTPAAAEAEARIRKAISGAGASEVALTGAELDAIRRVFELHSDLADKRAPLDQLRAELPSWL